MREILAKYFRGDGVIWGVVILLSLFSLLAVYSSTGSLAYQSQDASTASYILKHFSLLVLSLVIIFITHNIPYKYYSKLSQLFVVIAFVLLLLTLLMGTSVNQAKRWLTLPGIGLTIQTSDFAKLALVMYIARILSIKQYKVHDSNEVLGYLFIPTIIICGLILPANLSTALILFSTVMILLFVGRVRIKYLLGFLGIGIVLLGMLIGGIMLTGKEGRITTWQSRIEHFMDGEDAENYQVEQSKIAIATGGILGKGPGNSTQRDFLPYRAGVIVRRSTRTFGAFLSIGLALLLVIQAMINMGVTVHLIPVTGQTLPFVSMGGSSLLFTSIAIGIILSVSRSVGDEPANKKKKELKDE